MVADAADPINWTGFESSDLGSDAVVRVLELPA